MAKLFILKTHLTGPSYSGKKRKYKFQHLKHGSWRQLAMYTYSQQALQNLSSACNLTADGIHTVLVSKWWSNTWDWSENHLLCSTIEDKCEKMFTILEGIKPYMLELEDCEGSKLQTWYAQAADYHLCTHSFTIAHGQHADAHQILQATGDHYSFMFV